MESLTLKKSSADVNTLRNPKNFRILDTSKSKHNSTIEKKSIWVVVTGDSESARLTDKTTWDTESVAKNDVYAWYVEAKTDENCEGVQIDDDGLFACAYINGRYEFCEAFEVEP